MTKVLPIMSTEQAIEMKEKINNDVGAGPGGGGRERTLRTELKRRSNDGAAADVEKKRRRRPSSVRHNRRLRRSKTPLKSRGNLTNNAPFNSTQFLMNDHGGDTIQYLDTTLGVSKTTSQPPSERTDVPVKRVTRARESSFSLDSDEDFYYSSPEDEEEFVSQEFMKEYNNVRTDRLVDMTKADLIQEYLQMEQRVDSLEKRLNRHKGKSAAEDDTDTSSDSESKETTEKIRLFQKEILRLEAENESLRSANVVLLQQKKVTTSVNDDNSSCCSTCSSSSSSSSEGSSSEEEDDPPAPPAPPAPAKAVNENEKEDTGYESSHSGKKMGKGDDTVSSSTN